MSLLRSTAAFLLLLTPCVVVAQTRDDELRVIEAALQYHFNETMPYVESWVVSGKTEPLTPGAARSAFDAVRADYSTRNESPLELSELALPSAAELADLSPFTVPAGFDWPAFERAFPKPATYTARVSRPGFSDPTHAVVRVDTWSSVKQGPPLTTQIYLAKSGDRWVVVGGESPAVR